MVEAMSTTLGHVSAVTHAGGSMSSPRDPNLTESRHKPPARETSTHALASDAPGSPATLADRLTSNQGLTYRLEERIGVGGMGVVWRTREERSGQQFALKLPITDDGVAARNRRMLRREIDAMRQIGLDRSTDRLVHVIDTGTEPELFYVMTLFPDTLHGPLSLKHEVPIVLDALIQACLAVEQLHQCATAGHRLVHRDIKPDNFLVCWVGRRPDVRLADFGGVRQGAMLDRRTHDGLRTNGYAPPEQYLRLRTEADQSVDVFALAVVVVEALTGNRPMVAEQGVKWMNDDGLGLWKLQGQLDQYRRDEMEPPADLVAGFDALRTRPVHELYRDPEAPSLTHHEENELRNGLRDRLSRSREALQDPEEVADRMARVLLPVLHQALHRDPDRRATARHLRRACMRADRVLADARGVGTWSPLDREEPLRPASTFGSSEPPAPRPGVRRRASIIAGVGAVCLGLSGAVLALLVVLSPGRAPEPSIEPAPEPIDPAPATSLAPAPERTRDAEPTPASKPSPAPIAMPAPQLTPVPEAPPAPAPGPDPEPPVPATAPWWPSTASAELIPRGGAGSATWSVRGATLSGRLHASRLPLRDPIQLTAAVGRQPQGTLSLTIAERDGELWANAPGASPVAVRLTPSRPSVCLELTYVGATPRFALRACCATTTCAEPRGVE